jgi:hypothetical protein
MSLSLQKPASNPASGWLPGQFLNFGFVECRRNPAEITYIDMYWLCPAVADYGKRMKVQKL